MISDELINHLPDMYFDTCARGRFSHVSSYSYTLLGYSQHEMLQMSLPDLLTDPEQFPRILTSLSNRPGQSISVEAQVRTASGELRWLEVHMRGQFDIANDFIGAEGIARDISHLKQTQLSLRESEERYRRLAEATSEAIFIHRNGVAIDANRSASMMFGYSEAEMKTASIADIIAEKDIERVQSYIMQRREQAYEVTCRRKDGSQFPAEISPFQNSRDDPSLRVIAVRNLSEQKHTQSRLRILSEAIESSPAAIIISSADGSIEYVNSAAIEMTGCSSEQLLQHEHLADLFCIEREPNAKWLRWKHAMGQDWQGRLLLKRDDDRVCWVHARLTATRSDEDVVVHQLLVLEDITLNYQQQEQLRYQADYDGLTSLPNRYTASRKLNDIIKLAKQNNSQAALMFIDLDEFKGVNDSLGHQYGDSLLQIAADRIQQAVAHTHFTARFGGDEFLVMFEDIDSAAVVESVAERIIESFNSAFEVNGRELITTASIGLALFPTDGQDVQTLLRNADTAMNQVKGKGKNDYCFFNYQMNQEAKQRLKIDNHLRKALELGELSLNFQPVIDFSSGKLVGAEALLRWHNPELGFVSPEKFIPIAESTGLIVPIGSWVIHHACRCAKQWLDKYGEPFRVAVNVSPRQFQRGDLLETVKHALSSTGLPASHLEIEVTEGVLLGQRADIQRIFHALKTMGVRVAIDDFGTGYSSLAYLEKFRFNTLKIDKGFVAGMEQGNRRETLVKTIVSMAHGLDLHVVAEGVETAEQADLLSSIGCDFAQGYFYSKPLNQADFEYKLEQSRVSISHFA